MSHMIAPSILNSDFLQLGNVISMLNGSDADMIHLDIMDGCYVPNLTFGFPVIRQVKDIARKPLDVHLMIVEPDRHLEAFRDAGADNLTVHYEACTHLHRTLQRIRELGMLASVSLNPHTDVALLEPVLRDIHMVLIMTVNPGYGGQKFIEGSYDKIRKLKKMIRDAGASTLIQVDGGVGPENIDALIEAGVDVFVVGTTVFKAKDPAAMIKKLKNRQG